MRARRTWFVRLPDERGIVRETRLAACGRASARPRRARRDVAGPPGVGQRPGRRVGPRRDERLDVGLGHLGAVRPGRELVDLARELVQVVADELGEQAAGLRLGLRLVQLELVGDPACDRLHDDVPDQQLALRRDGLRERRVLLQLAADERERRPGRGRLQVVGDRFRVRAPSTLRRLRPRRAACPRRRGPSRCRRRPRRRRSCRRRGAPRSRRRRTGCAAAPPCGRPSAGRCRRSGRPV